MPNSHPTTVKPVIAIDFGGTQIRAAVVDPGGDVRGLRFGETGAGDDPAAVLKRIGDTAQEALDEADEVASGCAAIGVAAPGPLDYETGAILRAPNIPGFENIGIAAPLSERFKLPTFLGNDANLAVLAEHEYGAGRGVNNMVYVTVSTGVGAGILVNGELLLGSTGNAGEVGHMTVDFHADVHTSGNIGCVEQFGAGLGIARYAEELLSQHPESPLHAIFKERGELSARDVAAAARAGDALAGTAWDRAVRALGAGFVSFIHVLNPSLIVVGGGVANAGDFLLDPLRAYVQKYGMPGFKEDLRIVPWTLGEKIGILGAAAWARRSLRARPGVRSGHIAEHVPRPGPGL